MIYLSGATRAEVVQSGIGFIATPANGQVTQLGCYPAWAADNGCFAQADRFDLSRYLAWLDKLRPHQARCLFATAPDVVGDAQATWRRAAPALPLLREMGYRAALVAQDGLETMAVEWDALDCLFIGGSTAWKLSLAAATLVRQARERDKWVHMGRVNSRRRMLYAHAIGCQSCDGTYIKFGPDKNLPRLSRWVREVRDQTHLGVL